MIARSQDAFQMCVCECLTKRVFPSIGPRIVQTEEVVVTAGTEHDLKVVASSVASAATSSVIAEVAAAADLVVATRAVVSTPTTLVVVEATAEEAQLDATIDVATAEATLQTAVEVAAMTVVAAPVVADLQWVARPAAETAA